MGIDGQIRKDQVVVLASVRAAAMAGDIRAQALYAQMHCEGRSVVCDPAEGLHWYTLAANSGHAFAMNMVGRCHELGRGTMANAEVAAAWYRKAAAAAAGLDWGMYNLANLLATGRGVNTDRAGALRWYRRAAELGHAKSMNMVGRHYEEGWEAERNPRAALDWYRKSAHGGDFRGQASYAAILAQTGHVDEAGHWLLRAAETGTHAFLEHLGGELAESPHAVLRGIGVQMRARAAMTAHA
jgi:TPR repeat protein